jgi:hypothetical protein
MGKHSLNRHGNRAGADGADRTAGGAGAVTDAVDPESREMVEPDRDGSPSMSAQERTARSLVHADRDPEDDIHLAASDPRGTQGSG